MTFLTNLFLPHRENNHKAQLIKPLSLFSLSFLFVFLQVFLNFFLLSKPAVLGFSSNISPERVIELTNQERVKSGLGILKENELLSEAAKQKAADMFAFNYWSHVSPSGRTPWAFFTDVGYKYQYAGENLARDFRDPDSILRAWMNSASHKENILNSKYQETGLAVVDGSLQGVETTLVVQLFGTQYGAGANQARQQSAKESTLKETSAEVQPPKQLVKEVLARGTDEKTPVTSPLDLTKALAIFMIGILIGVFTLDFISTVRNRTPRFSSHSLAQMIFLIFILVASFLIKEGAIL